MLVLDLKLERRTDLFLPSGLKFENPPLVEGRALTLATLLQAED